MASLFHEFPFDSLTLKGCAGITPTNGALGFHTYDSTNGDSFDLATISLSSAKYIKITDISEFVLNDKNHPFYDATISGFDLDAIVVYHSKASE